MSLSLFITVHLLCSILLCVSCNNNELTSELLCPEESNGRKEALGTSCMLWPTFFDDGYRCVLTDTATCQGVTLAGEGSFCRTESNSSQLLQCKGGQWIKTDNLIRDTRSAGENLLTGAGAGASIGSLFGPVGGAVGAVIGGFFCLLFCDDPPPPVNHPPQIDCPNDIHMTAPQGSIVVDWDQPKPSDGDGDIISLTRNGPDSGSLFAEGRTTIRYRVRDSSGLTDVCTFDVVVTVPTCDDPPFIQHGRVQCSGNRRAKLVGTQCSVSCEDGYQLTGGPQTATCVQNGKNADWNSADFPTCEPVSCAVPTLYNLTQGDIVCPFGHTFQSICTISCKRGYAVDGSSMIICGENKQWSNRPSCDDITPPTFSNGCPPQAVQHQVPHSPNINVTWNNPDVEDNSRGLIRLTSDPQSGAILPPGFQSIKVTATDVAGNHAYCSFMVDVKPIVCNQPTVANGRVQCTDGIYDGSVCNVTCDEGFRPARPVSVTCLHSSWNDTFSPCQEVRCPPLPSVDNGHFADCTDGIKFQSLCYLGCDTGFSASRSGVSIQCQADGKWSSQNIYCHDTTPPVLKDGCPHVHDITAAPLGQNTRVTWTPPEAIDNAGGNISVVSDIQPGSVFQPGRTTVTYTAIDEAGKTARCSFDVTVNTESCGQPDLEDRPRARDLMTYDCNGHVNGAVCELSCNYGFPLAGSRRITCSVTENTNPHIMSWTYSVTAGKPTCQELNCTKLEPPVHGSLSCHLGNFGYECIMSCNEDWDVPRQMDGRFVCTNSNPYWSPPQVTNCTRVHRPHQMRMMSDILYYRGDCNVNKDEIRQHFLIALSSSTWADACKDVTCNVDNIEVFCGQTRRKRDATVMERRRGKRQSNALTISLEIAISSSDNTLPSATLYQVITETKNDIIQTLNTEATIGKFSIDSMTPDKFGFSDPTFSVDCPPGTLGVDSGSSFTCAGCSLGFYLPDQADKCLPCPIGQFTDQETATSCTPCPAGWSTSTTGSRLSSDCKEMCHAGTSSFTGFYPCLDCPPGFFQSGIGATSCDLCPAGTWTKSGRAISVDHCVPADLHLTNRTVTAQVTHQWTSLTLVAWVSIKAGASVDLKIYLDDVTNPLTVQLVSQSVQNGHNDNRSASVAVSEDTWQQLVLTVEPASQTASLYLQSTRIHSFVLISSPLSPTNVSLENAQDGVIISGLRAEGKAWNQSDITSSSVACAGSNRNNLLSWSLPSFSAVKLPSVCDAVDECQSSPCSSANNTCQNLPSSAQNPEGFKCLCQEGWSGDRCQVAPSACFRHACLNGATCVPGGNLSHSCVCDPLHTGNNCEAAIVDGGWSEWAGWTSCNTTCGGEQQQRQRSCDNPAPLNGGRPCAGNASESRICGQLHCPVHGNWSAWGNWSACSATCGGGERTRERTCSNPAPQYGGYSCQGAAKDKAACNTDICPIDGGWGEWTDWGLCSRTCGDGSQARQRTCDNPVPANGGSPCSGTSNDTQTCNLGKCPECAPLRRAIGTTMQCNETSSPYQKTCLVSCSPGYLTHEVLPLFECGEATGYLWNNQRDSSLLPPVPGCSRPRTPRAGTFLQSVSLNHGCDAQANHEVQNGVQNNMAALPCVQQNTCTATVTAGCETSHRSKRSATPLSAVVRLFVNFGPSGHIDWNDTANVQRFVDILRLAEQSALLLSSNATQTLFTTSVGGQTVTPDLSTISFNASLQCPEGSKQMYAMCVDCPLGTMEEAGQCVFCPVGQYQDETGSIRCKPCPAGSAWDLPGAMDIKQCLIKPPKDQASGAETGLKPGVVGIICGTIGIVACGVIIALYCYCKKSDRSARFRTFGSHMSLSKVHPSCPNSPPSYWDSNNFELQATKGRLSAFPRPPTSTALYK